MKNTTPTLLGITLIFALLTPALGTAAGVRRKTGAPAKAGFPAYNRVPTTNRVGAVSHVPARTDYLGNRVTTDHLNRVDFAHGRTDTVMRRDPHVVQVVNAGRTHFVNVYKPEFTRKSVLIDTSFHRYNLIIAEHPQYIGLWRNHGFYGGFYYGFHPIVDIDSYFYNPMVYWFYVGSFNDAYYRNWYATEYDAYPQLHHAFNYPGLYYPTDNLRQLLFAVSAMPVERQAAFRDAISVFTQRIAQSLANFTGSRVTLSKGDIVITHYEALGYDEAVVMMGFVNHNGTSYDLKGLLDLTNPPQTAVFAPVSLDTPPTQAQIQSLDQLNGRIDAMKGTPAPAPAAAEPTASTPTMMPEPPAGEISVDPEAKTN